MEKAQQLIEAMKAKEADLGAFSDLNHVQTPIPEDQSASTQGKRLSQWRTPHRSISSKAPSISTTTIRSKNSALGSVKAQRLESGVIVDDSDDDEEVASALKAKSLKSEKRNENIKHILQLLASLQFAMVIVITRERIPKAFGDKGSYGEGVIVLSMLLLTSASSKLEAVFGGEDGVKNMYDLAKFFCISVPFFVYMLTCEIWFMYLLFGFYDAEDHLQGLGDNKLLVLDIARVLSVAKTAAVLLALGIVPLTKACYSYVRERM